MIQPSLTTLLFLKNDITPRGDAMTSPTCTLVLQEISGENDDYQRPSSTTTKVGCVNKALELSTSSLYEKKFSAKLPQGTDVLTTSSAVPKCKLSHVEANNLVETKNGETVAAAATGSDDEEQLRCGWFGWNPVCMQVCNTPQVLLTCMSVCSISQGMLMNGFIATSVSSIEKRFGLTSRQTGLVAAMYDIAVSIALIPVCHYGERGHKGRWFGYGMLILGLGGIVYSIPQFSVGLYQPEKLEKITRSCSADDNYADDCDNDTRFYLSNYIYMFYTATVLIGIGAAPMYTLGITYLDESVSKKMQSMYIGTYYAMGAVGPALGYIVGGLFLGIYGDIGKVDTANITAKPGSPQWYGAWWIGPLFGGMVAMLAGIPILAFSRELPGSKKRKAGDVLEHYASSAQEEALRPGFGLNLRELPVSIVLLLRNPTFVFLTICDGMEAFMIAGFIQFSPKLLESIYRMTPQVASMIAGGTAVAGGAGGILLGSYIIKRLNMQVQGIMKLTITAILLSMLAVLSIMMTCSNYPFAGVTHSYFNQSEPAGLLAPCNKDCSCMQDDYYAICGSDKTLYYSPCYAGCTDVAIDGVKTVYTNCSCIVDQSAEGSNNNSNFYPGGWATAGVCAESRCKIIIPFAIVFFLLIFLSMVAGIPTQTAILRSVPFSQRSLALGIQWIAVRGLGGIPGPIILGEVIDATCLLWGTKCGDATSCLQYNNAKLSLHIMLMQFGVKIISLLCAILALILYKSPENVTHTNDGATHYGAASDLVQSSAEKPASSVAEKNKM